MVTSHALAKEHLVATTLRGEVLVFDLAAKPGVPPFRFRTPNGKGIGSSPAISGGRIYFGCDDGYFYVLGPDGNLRPAADDNLALHEPRGKVRSATGRTYGWPSTGGNAANTSFVDDPDLKPPLRVRWATRGFGHFKAPCIAYEGDVVSVTLQGLVTCQEQATGRMRWRMAMPGPESWTGAGLLADAGRLFVARPIYGRPEGVFHCLDLRTGRILWSAEIGGRDIWERSSPVVAGDLVAFGSTQPNKNGPPGAMIQAWDVETGKPAWQVDLNVHSNRVGDIAGCTDGKTMYFTAGVGDYKLDTGGEEGGRGGGDRGQLGQGPLAFHRPVRLDLPGARGRPAALERILRRPELRFGRGRQAPLEAEDRGLRPVQRRGGFPGHARLRRTRDQGPAGRTARTIPAARNSAARPTPAAPWP